MMIGITTPVEQGFASHHVTIYLIGQAKLAATNSTTSDAGLVGRWQTRLWLRRGSFSIMRWFSTMGRDLISDVEELVVVSPILCSRLFHGLVHVILFLHHLLVVL